MLSSGAHIDRPAADVLLEDVVLLHSATSTDGLVQHLRHLGVVAVVLPWNKGAPEAAMSLLLEAARLPVTFGRPEGANRNLLQRQTSVLPQVSDLSDEIAGLLLLPWQKLFCSAACVSASGSPPGRTCRKPRFSSFLAPLSKPRAHVAAVSVASWQSRGQQRSTQQSPSAGWQHELTASW